MGSRSWFQRGKHADDGRDVAAREVRQRREGVALLRQRGRETAQRAGYQTLLGLTTNLPFADGGNVDGIIVEGQEPPEGRNVSQTEQAEQVSVTPGTFQALGIPLLQGRDFQTSDHDKSPLVAIVDEPLARVLAPVMHSANASRQPAVASG